MRAGEARKRWNNGPVSHVIIPENTMATDRPYDDPSEPEEAEPEALFSCEVCGHVGPQHHFQVFWTGCGDHWACADRAACSKRRDENGD